MGWSRKLSSVKYAANAEALAAVYFPIKKQGLTALCCQALFLCFTSLEKVGGLLAHKMSIITF